eukprot:COSAG02_NODE_4423_length_5376_cov_8.233655_1_plen_199_part_10
MQPEPQGDDPAAERAAGEAARCADVTTSTRGDRGIEPEPEPELEPEPEPVANMLVTTVEEGEPPAEAEASSLVREAVQLYKTRYAAQYKTEGASNGRNIQAAILEGASRPVGVNWHFLEALRITLGNDQLRTEAVAEIMRRATLESKQCVVETFMAGHMVKHTHFVSHSSATQNQPYRLFPKRQPQHLGQARVHLQPPR